MHCDGGKVRKGVVALAVFGALVIFAAAPAATFGAEKAAMQQVSAATISGTVIEAARNRLGVVTKVAIKTEAEGDILVGKRNKGAELLAMLGQKVEVTGSMHKVRGRMVIDVTQYKAIE